MRSLLIYLLILISSCSPNKRLTSTASAALDAGTEYLKIGETKLNAPVIDADSILFKSTTDLSMEFGLEGADILYKLDNDEFQTYSENLSFTKSISVSAKTVKEGYLDSDEIEMHFIKVNENCETAKMSIIPEPDEQYFGHGIQSLFDHQKGSVDFRDGNKWCGFQEKLVSIDLTFKEARGFHKVYISTLNDAGSWIFNPLKIKVILDGQIVKEHNCKVTKEQDKAALNIIAIDFPFASAKTLELEIESMEAIPDWHPGKGTTPWLFLDEIIVE